MAPVDPPQPERPAPGGGAGDERRASPLRRLAWVALGSLAALLVLQELSSPPPGSIAYSEFKRALARGDVKDLALETGAVRGLRRVPPAPPAEGASEPPGEAEWEPFFAFRPDDPGLIAALDGAGVEYATVPSRDLTSVWFVLALAVPGVALAFLLLRRERAGLAGFGKSRARLVPETSIHVRFDDVAGCDEAKADLREMVDFLRDPGRFRALGARIPKGVLLLGPPGTGKTLLARAIAGEAQVPFFTIDGSNFVEMFVGVGAARVRDLFAQAKAKAPCIVFIDEIDAVGRQRGVSMGVVNDEREQTLNQLLSELDGFEENSGVVVLAATNRPEVLDRALLRPGRFDRQVVLDAPDLAGREAILRVHARGKPLAADADLARIAQATAGMSGADLANALNEAALGAARERRSEITQADVEAAIERVIAGPERRSRRLCAEEKRRVALHETGHALVAASVRHADPVRKISIVPRGRGALGYTLQVPEGEQYLRTRAELLDRLKVLLGGRAAEELALGDVSSGAQDDLELATAVARQMVCVLGMSERVGLQRCARAGDGAFAGDPLALQRDCSEATAREIDEEVGRLLHEARREARAILEARRPALERVSRVLLERETLDRAAFEALLGSEAEEAGLQSGDVPVQVGQTAVRDAARGAELPRARRGAGAAGAAVRIARDGAFHRLHPREEDRP